MAQAVNEKQLQKLLADGVSQREIARRLNIPRASLQRHIKALGQAPATIASIASNAVGIPMVDTEKLTPRRDRAGPGRLLGTDRMVAGA